MSAVRIWKPENPENLVLYLDVMSLGTNARQLRSGGVSDGSRLAIYIDARVPFFVLRARASCMRQAFVQSNGFLAHLCILPGSCLLLFIVI